MKVLKPNVGKQIQVIYKNHVFIAVTDYGSLYLLREVRVKYANPKSMWIWMELKEGNLLTIGSGDKEFSSFDVAINKMVNNPYCTVYDCEHYDEMMGMWFEGKIIYEDMIETIYHNHNRNMVVRQVNHTCRCSDICPTMANSSLTR